MNIERIDLVPIPVSDQAAALAFYTEKLGFEVRLNIPHLEDPSTHWIQLAPPGGETQVVLSTWIKPENFSAFILVTRNIEADYAELKQRGVEMPPLVTQPWGTSTVIKDPDGNELVLQQNTPLPGA
jgi:catechol 2,3-dioxygenase-like lactoylglutathione lyase family enzyme